MLERAQTLPDRTVGAALVLFSALLFASSGLFAKAVPVDAWTVIFWRALFAAVFLAVFLRLVEGPGSAVWRLDRVGLVVALISTVASAAFIAAFKYTTVANVTLIYASAPFVAAMIAWFWIGETPGRSSLIAAAVALAGVAITMGGLWGNPALGDFFALAMTVLMSLIVVIYRVFPKTSTIGPMMVSSLLSLPFAWAVADPFAVTVPQLLVLAAFGLCFSAASVALLAGAKRLRSAETALLSICETPLAPILAWLVLAELPARHAFLGGAMILAAVLWHLSRARRDP